MATRGWEPFASPFFLYFWFRWFRLRCATLRWQWQGVLWISVAALTIFVGLGIYSGDVLPDPAFELNCFLTTSVYLVVVAVMLGCLSTYEGEVRIALAARRSERRQWRPDGVSRATRPPRWVAPMTDRKQPCNRKPRAAGSRRIPRPLVEA